MVLKKKHLSIRSETAIITQEIIQEIKFSELA